MDVVKELHVKDVQERKLYYKVVTRNRVVWCPKLMQKMLWIAKFCITKLLQGRELFDGQNKCKHVNKLWDKTTNGKN